MSSISKFVGFFYVPMDCFDPSSLKLSPISQNSGLKKQRRTGERRCCSSLPSLTAGEVR